MDDQKIIKLLWQRTESAIEALAKKFGNRLMSIAMNILGVHQDAEESVNDTYLAVWNTVPPKKPDPLAGYVYATGRNISLDRLKYNTAEKRDGNRHQPISKLFGKCFDGTFCSLPEELNDFLIVHTNPSALM